MTDSVSLRGGSWFNLPWFCRPAFRYSLNPDIRYSIFGFRVISTTPMTDMNTTGPAPTDLVNHPPHYTNGDIECIDSIRAQLGREGFQHYCHGAVVKYLWRWRHKGGVEDLEKAQVYLMWLQESAEHSTL